MKHGTVVAHLGGAEHDMSPVQTANKRNGIALWCVNCGLHDTFAEA